MKITLPKSTLLSSKLILLSLPENFPTKAEFGGLVAHFMHFIEIYTYGQVKVYVWRMPTVSALLGRRITLVKVAGTRRTAAPQMYYCIVACHTVTTIAYVQ